ncbi:right-handed parallel beta-helix repeat-containing protein [Paenibacillus pasadenensis]|uniref:right-handed parallel beta-helix repeat-containing protein n=1 Tax=Paenibacillus pasadenensis TaxID=217090 RepID=UPI0020414D81|nr:right-handed parallel beta-helix repeat-containing protein [Paenibacillus pasadenensis]MCM3746320.1 right-handed parallel beta-helix repeat-containing protein [Paenibacillus pasadenensis]
MQTGENVYVKDFDGSDDAERIRAAIRRAIETGAERVVFEPRRYLLQSTVTIETEGFAHDAGSPDVGVKDCHLTVVRANKLTLEGAVDERGEPATTLVGFNDGEIHGYLPSILWCEDNESLTLRNLAFTREPEFASAGVVVRKDDSTIVVKVFEGNPCFDTMGAYCMNRFDPLTGSLIGESVTYGGGTDQPFVLTGQRELTLDSADVAAKVGVGEHLSWHQGARTDFQTYFGRCNSLVLDNIRTRNANGFAMLAESCRGITADRVVFRPDGNRLFTAPRDAWKLFKCSGEIDIRRMDIEGVRMDGQNMHSNWLVLNELLSPREAVFFCKYTFAPLQTGSEVEFQIGELVERNVINGWSHAGKGDHGNYYRIEFERDLPAAAVTGMLASAACWEPDRYLCQDSTFVNIAGAGHLVRYDHVTIMNCLYKNTMNPGILLGAELPVHSEGGHATDIVIKNCEFDNCGFYPRYDAEGCIGIRSAGFQGKHNRDILIEGNVMRNSAIGVHVIDGDDVVIADNRFDNVAVPVLVDPVVNGNVIERNHRIMPLLRT